MIDPFYHYTPDFEILVDLKLGIYTPEVEEDDVKKYYDLIIRWFHEILPKEGIPLNIIDKAILKISAQGKECIIEAQGRRFKSFEKFYV
ncbi:MAG: hypothetical protein P8Y97_09535 [Candidatus Lokiarchaeota archaeon]